jgi:predicted esterase
VFRTKQEAWESFRIGPGYSPDPAKRTVFPGGRFPVAYFDQFMKQAVPRWTSNNDAIQKAYDAYIQKIGPCIIIAHSQGGPFAAKAALNAPDKVKAVVLLEAAGTPDIGKENLAALKNVPHLFIWGDNIDKYPTWPKYYGGVVLYRNALIKSGVPVTWIELPKIGITGNSHMLIMDNNSDDIAAIVQKWLKDQKVMK